MNSYPKPTCVSWSALLPWYVHTTQQCPYLLQKKKLYVHLVRQVYPAAGFAWQVKRNSGHVAVFNIEASAGTHSADFFFPGGCEIELPKAIGIDGDFETPEENDIDKNKPN